MVLGEGSASPGPSPPGGGVIIPWSFPILGEVSASPGPPLGMVLGEASASPGSPPGDSPGGGAGISWSWDAQEKRRKTSLQAQGSGQRQGCLERGHVLIASAAEAQASRGEAVWARPG